MTTLDIILWVSAVGLWVVICVSSFDWFLKKQSEKNATRRSMSDLISEHRRLVSEHFEIKKRIEKLERKGRK